MRGCDGSRRCRTVSTSSLDRIQRARRPRSWHFGQGGASGSADARETVGRFSPEKPRVATSAPPRTLGRSRRRISVHTLTRTTSPDEAAIGTTEPTDGVSRQPCRSLSLRRTRRMRARHHRPARRSSWCSSSRPGHDDQRERGGYDRGTRRRSSWARWRSRQAQRHSTPAHWRSTPARSSCRSSRDCGGQRPKPSRWQAGRRRRTRTTW